MLISVCIVLEALILCLNPDVAHAGPDLAPITISYGLERFGALCHLDMQSACGEDTLHIDGDPAFDRRLDLKLKHLALQPAAVKELAALAGTLQTLRLVYIEDVPGYFVRLSRACMTSFYALLCTMHSFASPA